MGLLLFAARKRDLKKQILDLNARNMQLSIEQQNVQTQIANAQQAINAARNTINIFQTQAQASQGIAQSFGVNANSNQVVNFLNSQAGNAMNSVFDNLGKAQLARLNAMDSQITLELESNQNLLETKKAEYDNVKAACSESAKNSAPGFGLNA